MKPKNYREIDRELNSTLREYSIYFLGLEQENTVSTVDILNEMPYTSSEIKEDLETLETQDLVSYTETDYEPTGFYKPEQNPEIRVLKSKGVKEILEKTETFSEDEVFEYNNIEELKGLEADQIVLSKRGRDYIERTQLYSLSDPLKTVFRR